MKTIKQTSIYVVLIGISIIMLFPFFWLISSSFKELSEIFKFPPTLWVKNFTLENYNIIFKQYSFQVPLINSVYISMTFTLLAVFFCSLAGYAFAKYDFVGRRFIFLLVLGSLMIPFETTMVPLYAVFKNLGWIDKHIGLIVPGLANAFGIFFMTQYMQSISDEIIESGRIDGCSEIAIFIKLVLPIAKPGVASLGIIFFMRAWNDFLWPLIILKTPQQMTLAVALRSLVQGIRTPHHLIMAGSVISILPLIIIFVLFQNYFIEGLSEGAIKG